MDPQKAIDARREGPKMNSLSSLAVPIVGEMSIDELRAALTEAERQGVTRVSLHAEFAFNAADAAKRLGITLPEMSEYWRVSCRRYENAKGTDASWVRGIKEILPDDTVDSEMIRHVLLVMKDKAAKQLK